MPGLDGTGPWGAGPMTGRGMGFCNPAWRGAYGPWYRGWYGRGWFGWGRGYGRGWRWRTYAPGWAGPYWGPAYWGAYGPYEMSPSEEAEMLKAEAEDMKRALDEISKRIEELERQQQAET